MGRGPCRDIPLGDAGDALSHLGGWVDSDVVEGVFGLTVMSPGFVVGSVQDF